MKTDIFTHIMPKRYYEFLQARAPGGQPLGIPAGRIQSLPALWDLDARFKIMDIYGDYSQVLTLAHPSIEELAGPKESPDIARAANDAMAELVVKYPQRFAAAVASLPLNNIDAALKEVDRAVKDLHCRGIQLFTNIMGKPLDLPEFQPIFEKMAGYDLPIWIHPARTPAFADYATEDRSKYQVYFAFGWPYETGVAMARILFTGIFDRHPNLKIITHHIGGVVPFFDERITGTYDQYRSRQQPDDTDDPLSRLKRKPIDYFRMFYADTASFGSLPAIECGLAFFGAEHLLFGTDHPFAPEGGSKFIRETIRALDGATMFPGDRQKVYQDNARRLLKL